MDFFIFTYSGDADLLPLCIGHAARHGHVVIVDQDDSPAFGSAADALALGAAEYVRSTFPRRGNLNGVECVRGMLECYRDYSEADWVMQVDSNMLLFRPDLLAPRDDEHVGVVGQASGFNDAWAHETPVLFARGGGLMLKRCLIPAMLEHLARPDIEARIEAGKAFSDHVITVAAKCCGGALKLLRHEGARVVDGVACRVGWFTWEEHNRLWEHAAAVHFYERCAPAETAAERHALTLDAMRRIAAERAAVADTKMEQV